ncbi:MAG: DUF2520 domain-containing protein [Candidatus Aminicenantes bacterium]|nr:DUF2520 domain-containing protein [Candidatus Aminicenantes bacterium]
MTEVAIIGAGNLGTALGYALSQKGYQLKALSGRTLSSVRKSLQIIGKGKALTDNLQAAKDGKLIFICVPDSEIAKVVKELAQGSLPWKEKYVFHCSGLVSAEVLKPLQIKGAFTASIHPVQSFSQKKGGPNQFEGIYFGLEGDEKALKLGEKIASRLGGYPIIITGKDKALYHAACSIASNFFVVLLEVAVSLLKSAGIEEKQASEMVLPLIQGTLQNMKDFGLKNSLTGPVIRGDQVSIRQHLDALRKLPDYIAIYKILAVQALEIAKKRNLPPEKYKALKSLLEEK